MSASTAKRLILYRFDRPPVEGLVHADAYLLDGGMEVMSLDGNVQVIDYRNVKALCFAAEGAPADLSAQTAFERRPKTSVFGSVFDFVTKMSSKAFCRTIYSNGLRKATF